ncbi:hypothetical protein BTH_II0993 [Burkholderia thailandensis E264]|uniref:Uncharacterized protein n=1 Tax=Burkholderia thailandensis (strain ATCC 700388 / DSM 13276 / CCUG 48851 / CIP 106301 / E264) TaxID=271848 RepID=Q2T6L0_BURTA|nr:hypothetical protein BTH_II0993 [Burkholderia thailandensis E264]
MPFARRARRARPRRAPHRDDSTCVDERAKPRVANLEHVEQPERAQRRQRVEQIPLGLRARLRRRLRIGPNARVGEKRCDGAFANRHAGDLDAIDVIGKNGLGFHRELQCGDDEASS